ncbi:Utp14-domain-containing protein [Flagelloscypha sp. PMI_526]|nr:Utp14-domain-containing protein [Flagelloscypha sp. PMI_526]
MAKSRKLNVQDVYSHTESSSSKRKGKGKSLRLGRHEHAYLDASELDSHVPGQSMEVDNVRLVGDEGLGSDDEDEEIDSEDAFESDDDEQFAGFYSKKLNLKQVADVDLDENEMVHEEDSDNDSEQLSGNEDEYMDILDVLDGRATIPGDEEGSEQENSQLSGDSDDDSPSTDKLTSLIHSLPTSSKRPLDESLIGQSKPKRRRLLAEQTVAGASEDNPFRAISSSSKLTLQDLFSVTPTLQTNDKKLKKTGIAPVTLPAPLPLRHQEKINREAAYDETKSATTKQWGETMKHIREAEFLSFPLQKSNDDKIVSDLSLASHFKPSNPLESGIAGLLKKAGLASDGDMINTETEKLDQALQRNEISREELQKRRQHLRQMRDLTLRAEQKAARANKIKSKVYRKLRRKEKAKLNQTNDDEDQEEDEATQKKRELERIRARAGLKVKSKRAHLAHHSSEDEDEETTKLDREERLAELIQGGPDIASDSSSDEEDDGDNEDHESWTAKSEFAKLDVMNSSALANVGEKHKGVMQMKFMQDAIRRKEKEVDEDVDAFIAGLGEINSDDQGDMRTGGRVSFRPSAMPSTTRKIVDSDTDQDDALPTPPPRDITPASGSSTTLSSSTFLIPPAAPPLTASDASNPWLTRANGNGPVKKKANEVLMSQSIASSSKGREKVAKYKMEKRAEKGGDQQVKIAADGSVVLVHEEEDDEGAYQESLLDSGKNKERRRKEEEQREIVALAFGGDGAEKHFAQIKKREVEEDAPKEVDTTLPGWGAWGGAGVKKDLKKPNPKLVKHISGIKESERKDKGKAHLIISEKADRKASKYTVSDLPYPFTSRKQYEASLERPVGKEWNTRVGFQRATLPKVVVKPGTVVEALEGKR